MYSIESLILLVSAIAATATDVEYGRFLLSGSNLEWPSAEAEKDDILAGHYDPQKILVHGVQMDDQRAFVIMPRFSGTGVPWTLGVFRLDAADFEPDIRPYPDFGHYGPPCRGRGQPRDGHGGNLTCIVNVVDAYVEGGALWALDAGTANALSARPRRLAPPRLIRFDLAADRVTSVTDLSPVTGPHSAVTGLVARRTRCGRLYVYVADAGGRAILAYDAAADGLHAIPLPVSRPGDGAAALHLMAVDRAGKSYAYFAYGARGGRVFALSTWCRDAVVHGAVDEVGAQPVAMHVLGTDRGTNVYFRSASGHRADVWSWDVNRPLDVHCFRLVHRGYMHHLTATAVAAGWRGAVWTVESNYEEYVAGRVDCTGPRTLLRPLGYWPSECCGRSHHDRV